jgi:hypothetical protein
MLSGRLLRLVGGALPSTLTALKEPIMAFVEPACFAPFGVLVWFVGEAEISVKRISQNVDLNV